MAEPPKRFATRRHGESYGVGTWRVLARVARVKTGKIYNLRVGISVQRLIFFLQGETIQRHNEGIIMWTPASRGLLCVMKSTEDQKKC